MYEKIHLYRYIYIPTHIYKRNILNMSFMCRVIWGGMELLMPKFVKEIENDKKYTHTKALTCIPQHTVEKSYGNDTFCVGHHGV